MRLMLFGATGRTGTAFIEAAMAHYHEVYVYLRPGTSLTLPVSKAVIGRFEDGPTLAGALMGCDAAVCVIGPRATDKVPFCAAATRAILDAMQRAGVRRFVCVTGGMVGALPPNVSLPMRGMAALYRLTTRAMAEDRAAQEATIRASGVDWTILKPPRLTDGPAMPRVLIRPDLSVGMMSSISRASLARMILTVLEENLFVNQAVYVRES